MKSLHLHLLVLLVFTLFSTKVTAQFQVSPNEVDDFVDYFYDAYGDHPGIGVTPTQMESYLASLFPFNNIPGQCAPPNSFYLINTDNDGIELGWNDHNHAINYEVTVYALDNGVHADTIVVDTSTTFNNLTQGLYLATLQIRCDGSPRSDLYIIIIDKPLSRITEDYFNGCSCHAGELIYSGGALNENSFYHSPVSADYNTTPDAENIYLVSADYTINNQAFNSYYYLKIEADAEGLPMDAVYVSNSCSAYVGYAGLSPYFLSTIPNIAELNGQPISFYTFSNYITFDPNDMPDGLGNRWSLEIRKCYTGELSDTDVPFDPSTPPGGNGHSGNNEGHTLVRTSLNAMPNPAKDHTTLAYTLAKAGEIRLSLFNELGQEIRLLYQGLSDAGEHRLQIDWAKLPVGIYTCYLTTSTEQQVLRLIHQN